MSLMLVFRTHWLKIIFACPSPTTFKKRASPNSAAQREQLRSPESHGAAVLWSRLGECCAERHKGE
eukprot:5234006-Amphidinium_carterae.1